MRCSSFILRDTFYSFGLNNLKNIHGEHPTQKNHRQPARAIERDIGERADAIRVKTLPDFIRCRNNQNNRESVNIPEFRRKNRGRIVENY